MLAAQLWSSSGSREILGNELQGARWEQGIFEGHPLPSQSNLSRLPLHPASHLDYSSGSSILPVSLPRGSTVKWKPGCVPPLLTPFTLSP